MAAEIVVGLLGPIIEVAKCIAAPIKRQFSYLCCFNSNVQILAEEAQNLENVRDGVQREVDTAERNAQVIDAQVKDWLDKVKKIQEDKSELDEEIANASKRGCWSMKYRYSASRRAVKTVEAMKQKRVDRRDIDKISHGPLPTSPAAVILARSVCDFESRAKIEEALTTMLKDENVAVVGICGMGGVGKTTMAEKIKNKLRKENTFGDFVTAVVSQSLDKKKIQGEIAEQLDLKLDENSLSKRAERLCTRLMGGKRVLLILDDVWEHLDLNEIGIPSKSGPEGCTILITSRDKRVLTRMGIVEANILKLEVLSKEEAWSFFKEKLGDQILFSSLALEIADKCSGLPLALASVAGVLKDEKEISVWRNALQQLRSGNPEDLPDVLKEVYTPLKLSYDYLSNENAKTIFLLCSLFPEDSYIGLQALTIIAMGLSMFEGIENLEPARDRVETLIGMLKHRSLLLEDEDGDVKMHDVVRDVAIFIASKAPEEKQLIKCGYQSTWISPFVGGERIKFYKESTFPNLRLLMIQDSKDEELHINDISFEGMKELNVLFIISNFSWISLSLTQNLRTLVLVKCESLEAISAVGDLWNLEILICHECDAIKEFPSETLKSLKVLEISDCKALENIGSAGVLSCPDKRDFEHIKITFPKLESLVLQDLENLRVFYQGIDSIEFPLLSHVKIKDCPQLEDLTSSFGGSHMNNDHHDHSLHLFCKQKVSFGNLMKRLRLRWPTNCDYIFCPQIPIGYFTHLEKLHVSECANIKILFPFSIAQNLGSLKLLRIETCNEMEKVIEEAEEGCSHDTTLVFPHLEQLILRALPRLKTFYKAALGFPKLVKLEIKSCPEMGGFNLGSLTTPNLESLESVYIKNCERNMEHVFWWSEVENENSGICHSHHITFPNLRTLDLYKLTMLTSIFKGVENIEFPHITKMSIIDCPNPKSVVSATTCSNSGDINNEVLGKLKEQTFTMWHQIQIGSFATLEDLSIYGCDEISCLFTSSIASKLINLKKLGIGRCKEMVKVIEGEFEEYSHETTLLFPRLEELRLSFLPQLKSFCEWKCALELPLLEKVEIEDCPKMERFSLGSLTAPKLESIKIYGELIAGELNDVMQPQVLLFGKSMKHLFLRGLNNLFCLQIPIGTFTHLEELRVWNCGNDKISFPFSIAQNLDSLKLLKVWNCNEMEKVIEEAEEGCSHDTTLVFPHLEELILYDLPQLKTFCNSALGFPKLVHLEILRCPEMGGFNLGSLTTLNLESLESVRIEDSLNMEQVFWWSEVENENSGICHSRHVKFPNLRNLTLNKLTRLTSIFKGVESIEFPHIKSVRICDCPNLKSVVSATTCSNSGDINNEAVCKLKEQTSSIWDQIAIGSFTTLEDLSIWGFDVNSSLFSSSIARKLINLKELRIGSCKEMVKVIEGEVEEYSHETTLLFPHLKELDLFFLPQLKSFCEWKCPLELPLLETVEIYRCPKMERFSLESLTTPKLESIVIEHRSIKISGDLNDMLRHHSLRLQEEPISTEGEDETEEEEKRTLSEVEGGPKENDEIKEEDEPNLSESIGDHKDEIKKEEKNFMKLEELYG